MNSILFVMKRPPNISSTAVDKWWNTVTTLTRKRFIAMSKFRPQHRTVFSIPVAISAIVALLALTVASANAGPGYLYVGEYDSTATTEASVDLPINAQTVSTKLMDEHSLFEMSMSNEGGSSGNIIEAGITTDVGLNGDMDPHWFVSSWINGVWKGYDASSDFVSEDGNFWTTPLTLDEGTSQSAAFQYSSGDWWLDLDGVTAGYFPGSEWSGAFTKSLITEVFGEVYWDGTFYPTLDGTVSGYSSSGRGQLYPGWSDSPYEMSDASATGFTALGPVPEPSTFSLAGIAAISLAGYGWWRFVKG